MRRLFLAALLGLAGVGPARGAQTIVTLGFDDGSSDQVLARQLLDARGLKGTFYINSAMLGSSGWYMTKADVDGIFAAGHEIGGHTLHHYHLTTLTSADQQTEICGDRQTLLGWGYNPVSLAYPFGEYNATTESIARSCGYAQARTVGGIGCSGCAAAETLPPPDLYAVRSPNSVQRDTTLAQIEAYVTAVENAGGGWVPLVFHHVCDGCDTYAVSTATLGAFLDWLKARAAQGTVVQTAAQALSGPGAPPPSISSLSPSNVVAGAAAFTLTVNGANFAAGSTVTWNGSGRATTFVDAGRLRAAVGAADVASAGTAQVAVAYAGASYGSAAFTISASTPGPGPGPGGPVIQALSPSQALAGCPPLLLTVNGSNFSSGAAVLWNGAGRPTTFVSSSQLRAAIPASDLAAPARAAVAVSAAGAPPSPAASFDILDSVASQPALARDLAGVRVFPNPWRADRDGGDVSVTLDGLTPQSTVRIYTISGRAVRTLDGATGSARWDLTNGSGERVASGLYLYLIRDGDGRTNQGVLGVIR